jgi:hypothetical protein
MTDFIDVVEHNPIVFVKRITEEVKNGYFVQNTNQGYPQFTPYGNAIRLFKSEQSGAVVLPVQFTGKVEHYDPMGFVLLLECAVKAGYTFKDNGSHYFDEKGLKSVELEIVTEVKEEKTPAKKAPAKKALKAEPTKEELEGGE